MLAGKILSKWAIKPLVLLSVYVMHTFVFHLLSFSNHHNFDPYVISHNQGNKPVNKRKPYSFFVVKHVCTKVNQQVTKSPIAFAETPFVELPKAQSEVKTNLNSNLYRLPDDSYKRYRTLRVLLI